MSKNLFDLMSEVDKVNQELLDLINYRTSIIKEIGGLKDIDQTDYFDPLLEKEMLEKLIKNNNGHLSNELVKEIFTEIFRATLQHIGINKEKKLLISSDYDNSFLNLKEMFNLKDNEPIIIAGPCAVEKIEYLESVAKMLNENGVRFLRAGAFKPRTSPYDFQGLKKEGLKMLKQVGKKFDLITISEVVDTRDVEMMSEYVDIIQIGARNMHNFELLKEVGQTNHPILLKRGINATIEEFMLAAEYIGLMGNRKIILCERGIRTFETKTRNTLDISCIPIIKKETSLPIIVDLSHSLGRKDIICQVGKAALAVGSDGIMVEVHPCPEIALSDSKQQLNYTEFKELLQFIK